MMPFFGNVRRAVGFAGPRRWRTPERIFVCELSDFFHPAADKWRRDAWAVMREAPQHTYIILTKRPERMIEQLPWQPHETPWSNVWFGVTVEQQRFVHRVLHVLRVPAVVHFVSLEPLLGPVDLGPFLSRLHHAFPSAWVPGPTEHLEWVIVGGESGRMARPMELRWARDVVTQCKRARVPVFMKQLSQNGGRGFKDFERFPRDLRVREYPRLSAKEDS
jgi:protein gp37